MAFAGWLIGVGLYNIIQGAEFGYFWASFFSYFVGAAMFAWAGYEIEKALK